MHAAAAEASIRLYPAPREEATTLVSVMLSRVIRIRENSTRETGGLELYPEAEQQNQAPQMNADKAANMASRQS